MVSTKYSGPTIPVARGILGTDHHSRDYAIVAGSSSSSFLAAIRWNRARSRGWSNCGELSWRRDADIWRRCVSPGMSVCPSGFRPTRISIRRRDPGDCPLEATRGSSVADRVSSIHRSVDRNRGGADLQRLVAGEGRYTRGTILAFATSIWLMVSLKRN
jgi:hypothetical protein